MLIYYVHFFLSLLLFWGFLLRIVSTEKWQMHLIISNSHKNKTQNKGNPKNKYYASIQCKKKIFWVLLYTC